MNHIWLCENAWKFIFNENENLGDWGRVASRKMFICLGAQYAFRYVLITMNYIDVTFFSKIDAIDSSIIGNLLDFDWLKRSKNCAN